MSQASKKVEWCLRKAEKELGECEKLGKRPKHRGLIKINPSKKMIESHLNKAEENLNFALSLNSERYGYKVIESLFYSIYHCFLAIISKFGYESGNQTCTIDLIEYLKEINKIDLNQNYIDMMKYKDEQGDKNSISFIEMREDYTYGSKVSIEKERIEKLVEIVKELIHDTKEIVYKNDRN